MSKNRNFSKLVASVDNTGKVSNSSAISQDAVRTVESYDSINLLPTSGLTNADRALVSDRLFISNGSGWYNFSLVNLNPRITSGPEGAEFRLDSTSPETITMAAADSDGTPIIWQYIASSSASDLATIVNDSNGVFTITGKSLADILSAGYDSTGGSFTLTFKASDGIAFDADSASFTVKYVIDWTQQQKLVGASIVAGEQFGVSAAISNYTAVVGAQNDGTNGTAHIFTRSGSTWSQQTTLIPSGPTGGAYSGRSVGIDSDTVVVGSYFDDASGYNNAGSMTVFTRSNGSWSQLQHTYPADIRSPDNFGRSVAVHNNTIVAGAPAHDTNGVSSSGAAYVYTRPSFGNTFSQQSKLEPPDPTFASYFGWDVDIYDNTAAISEYRYDSGGDDRGVVHIFTRSGSTWSRQTTLAPNDPRDYHYFGSRVSLESNTLAIAAQGDSNSRGALYIFAESDGTWTQQQKLTAAGGNVSDQLGRHGLSLSGNKLIVGATGFDSGGLSSIGAAYISTRENNSWTSLRRITANDGAAGDNFGYAVGINDSNDTAIIAGYGNNSEAGAAYIFTPE